MALAAACERRQSTSGGRLPRLLWFTALIVFFAGAGCKTASRPAVGQSGGSPLVARFFLETKTGEPGVAVTLPQSGVAIAISPKPVLVEYDIVNAEVAKVDLGHCLLVQLSAAASRDLFRLSVNSTGRRLVLSLNDEFLGARRIEGAMSEGAVLIFLEVPDEKLPEIVDRLKATSAQVAQAAAKAHL